jgi:hypothetical protein
MATFNTLLKQANRAQLNRVDNAAKMFKTSSSSVASSGVAENESLAMLHVVLVDMQAIEEDVCDSSGSDDEESASAAGA